MALAAGTVHLEADAPTAGAPGASSLRVMGFLRSGSTVTLTVSQFERESE